MYTSAEIINLFILSGKFTVAQFKVLKPKEREFPLSHKSSSPSK